MTKKLLKTGLILATTLSFSLAAQASSASGPKGKVLVIVSSAHELTLQDGKTYPTGFYLNELTVPVRALMDNGYEVTFANPEGNTPSMDVHSDSATYFGGNAAKYQDYENFLSTLTGLQKPKRISEVIQSGLAQFDGVFFPGGHAPMEDLLRNRDVGTVLDYFHSSGKPTALICHAPISLLAALPNSKAFTTALAAGNTEKAQSFAQGWIYAGYNMTIFSTPEEQHAEAVQLGGKVLFYPDEALRAAGGNVNTAIAWQSNAIRDRELITGQNPFSDEQLAGLLLAALSEQRK